MQVIPPIANVVVELVDELELMVLELVVVVLMVELDELVLDVVAVVVGLSDGLPVGITVRQPSTRRLKSAHSQQPLQLEKSHLIFQGSGWVEHHCLQTSGSTVGLPVGALVLGSELGPPVGEPVVGIPDGLTVGLLVGDVVGLSDGAAVLGDCDGRPDGCDVVGDWVGPADGFVVVGDTLGPVLGRVVGAADKHECVPNCW